MSTGSVDVPVKCKKETNTFAELTDSVIVIVLLSLLLYYYIIIIIYIIRVQTSALHVIRTGAPWVLVSFVST